ncbi:MAG: PmbA/TldA family metallopeptidase, partial [Acidimicrobiales bacterium]
MLDDDVVSRTLGVAMATGGDFAEVFAEDKRSSSALLDDGRIEELTSGRDRGAGIRVVVGDTTGFAHTADLSESGLASAAQAAAAAARGGGGGTTVVDLTRHDVASPVTIEQYPEDVAKATKVELLTDADEAARAEGGSISQVMARYADSRRRILVANTDGLLTGDDQVKTLFSVSWGGPGGNSRPTTKKKTKNTTKVAPLARFPG